jgi:hypothetical protein
MTTEQEIQTMRAELAQLRRNNLIGMILGLMAVLLSLASLALRFIGQ